MIKKLDYETWKEHYSSFQQNFSDTPELKLLGFHPIQLPVVVCEAYVKMRSVQDYSVLSLLILRLFDAGICTPEAIQSISGLSQETVNVYLEKEMIMLEHIDPDTKELTEFGRETLRLNKDAQGTRVQSCQNFDSVVRVHIDPLTGSLIPQYLEWELADNFEPDPQLGDFLKPRDSASVDEAFRDELRERLTNELNERKDEYVSLDTMKNGDILNHVDRFNPILVFYRWGYLAKFKGMRSPMIILTGKKNIGNVNADTAATGIQSKFVAVPIALCRTDYAYLQRHGITFDQTMVRDDDCFDELIEETEHMILTLPDSGEEEEI